MSRQSDDRSWEEEHIHRLGLEIKELESQLKLTQQNLVFILENNKSLLLPPTLTFKKQP